MKTPLGLPNRPTTVIAPDGETPELPESPIVATYAQRVTLREKTTSYAPRASLTDEYALSPRASDPSALTTAKSVQAQLSSSRAATARAWTAVPHLVVVASSPVPPVV